MGAEAPAKVNLILRVGSPDESGYHPLVTVFQAVELWDRVHLRFADNDTVTVSSPHEVSGVPLDSSNIAWKAMDRIRRISGKEAPVALHIDKAIPVAGGMAGGSADAAAALLAANALFETGLSYPELLTVAAELGSDVSFSLLGGMAVGEGRGERLTPLLREEPLALVIVRSPGELSTAQVYRHLDELREGRPPVVPEPLTLGLAERLQQGSAPEVAPLLANDLQEPALSLMPELQRTLDEVREAGAVAALVSGSGPTVLALAWSALHQEELARALQALGYQTESVLTSFAGARLLDR